MVKLFGLLGVGIAVASLVGSVHAADIKYTMKTLAGKEVDLTEKYDGKVMLIVNVASNAV